MILHNKLFMSLISF